MITSLLIGLAEVPSAATTLEANSVAIGSPKGVSSPIVDIEDLRRRSITVQIADTVRVVVDAIDANHCSATMFNATAWQAS